MRRSIFSLFSTRRVFLLSVFLFCGTALCFWYLQNVVHVIGGEIALAKLFWLFLVLFYWYVLPPLILLETRLDFGLKKTYVYILILLVLRAVVELWMMYVTKNWHPILGISHDCLVLGFIEYQALFCMLTAPIDKLFKQHLHMMSTMIFIEIGFAYYFWKNVRKGDSHTFFIPDSSEHHFVFQLTWVAVSSMSLWLLFLFMRWFNGKTKS